PLTVLPEPCDFRLVAGPDRALRRPERPDGPVAGGVGEAVEPRGAGRAERGRVAEGQAREVPPAREQGFGVAGGGRPPPAGTQTGLVAPACGLPVTSPPGQQLLGHGLPEADAPRLGRALGDVSEGLVEDAVELLNPAGVELYEGAVGRDRRGRRGVGARLRSEVRV